LSFVKGGSDRMYTGDKASRLGGGAFFDFTEGRFPHTSHDPHVDDHVGGVGHLDPELGERRIDRTHAEGHHIHGTTPHRPGKFFPECRAHLLGVRPVIRRAGVLFAAAADKGAVFDAGDVVRIRAREVAVRAFFGVESFESSRLNHQLAELFVFFLRAIAPVDIVGLAELFNFFDPLVDFKTVANHAMIIWENRFQERDEYLDKLSADNAGVCGARGAANLEDLVPALS